MDEEKQVILNFGVPLTDNLKKEISSILNKSVEEKHFVVGINMKKNIFIQCVDIVDKVDTDNLPTDYVVNLPGLPIAAVYLCTELEARTGVKPAILELHREKDERGIVSDFHFGKIRNLELEAHFSRKKREEKRATQQ